MTLIASLDELPASGRLMALDHGSKTIGVAITDEERHLAQPIDTIPRKKLSLEMASLQQMVQTHQPVAFIIGYPLNMDGSEGPRCQSVRAFVRNLEQYFEQPMLLWDERLSTSDAHDTLKKAGVSAKKRQGRIDHAAAAIILETLLATYHETQLKPE